MIPELEKKTNLCKIDDMHYEELMFVRHSSLRSDQKSIKRLTFETVYR